MGPSRWAGKESVPKSGPCIIAPPFTADLSQRTGNGSSVPTRVVEFVLLRFPSDESPIVIKRELRLINGISVSNLDLSGAK